MANILQPIFIFVLRFNQQLPDTIWLDYKFRKVYNLYRFILLLLNMLFFCSKSLGQKEMISSAYHNMTAHYNSYFIAAEDIATIERRLKEKYDWNYNQILPIYPPFDSTFSKSVKKELEDCIEKSSMSIQWHPKSRWEDDAYLLVGIARFYGSEFKDAVETFKYVNTNGQNKHERHKALIWLFRTFIEAGEINNAIAVSDYMKKLEMNRENLRNLYLTRAYFYQKREDYSNMVSNLVKAEELMSSTNEKARIDFIIGQVYQHLGFDASAYHYYNRSLRKSKSYELQFYTKLNMAQVTTLSKNQDIKRTEKYFTKLIKDPKNKEYLDRIYYERASFNLKQGDLKDAIDDFNLSLRSNGKSQRQKGMAYHKLAIIHYDSLKKFELAKLYYDSTVTFLPSDERIFIAAKKRQEVLEEFVKNLQIIQRNDSLIALSSISSEDIEVMVNQKLADMVKERELAKEKALKEKKRLENASSGAIDPNQLLITITDPGTSGTWYFYNPNAISQGQQEFRKKWGDRPLEDNWRRKNKTALTSTSSNLNTTTSQNKATTEAKNTNPLEDELDVEAEKAKILANLPTSDEAVQKLIIELHDAYYALGNIYKFKLEEKENAIKSFETLVNKYPGSRHEPEALYQLYLLYKSLDSLRMLDYAESLREKHPESIFARLIDNPNYREESKALNEQFKKIYEKAYQLYKDEQLNASLKMIDSALVETQPTDYHDNLSLLRAMVLGKLDGYYIYQFELNNFIKDYSESELIPYAKKLVKASEDYQINLYSSSKAKYLTDLEEKHYFVLLYPRKSDLSEKVPKAVQDFVTLKKYALKSGNLILNEHFGMVLLNDFPGKKSAEFFCGEFLRQFNYNAFLGEKIYTLVFSITNFEIFYETKDLQTYLTFFDQQYKP